MARPSKLTPALQKRIVGLIEAGNYSAQAAAACGIAESTFFNYMRDGRDVQAKLQEYPAAKLTADEKKKLEFLVAVRKAEAKAEAEAVALVQKAARAGTHQAAQWYLERKFPDRWGRNDRSSVSVETTIKENATPSKSREELLQELQELEHEG